MFNIVLDTEVFRKEMLNFNASRFQKLAEFVEKRQASIYLSDVVVGETKRAIADRIREAAEYLRRKEVRRTVGYLQHSLSANVPGIGTNIDQESARKDLEASFEKLLVDLRATIICSNSVSVSELRRRYFGPVAPFALRTEKKHEFPDALTFLAVEQYATEHDVEMLIVSADKGFASAVDGHSHLRCVTDVRDLIDQILKRTESVAAAADRIDEILGEEFEGRIAEQFVESGFTIVDENGDVDEVTVKSVSFLHTYVAEIEGDIATIDFEAEVDFSADVSYDDPDQSVRDSETGEVYVFGSIDRVIDCDQWVEGQAVIKINIENLSASEILDFDLFGDFTIEVSPPENYK
jgi:PIN domain-containing protein